MRRFKKTKTLGLILLSGIAMWLGVSGVVAWKLTRRPAAPFAEPPPEIEGVAAEEYRLPTGGDQQIGAWLVRGDDSAPCVLLLHGYSECRGSFVPLMKFLAARRLTVMAVSLRCHGDSTGAVNDFGYGARHDVVAAVEFLERQCPGRPVFVVGRSLGSAAALFAAGPLAGRVDGYLLESPYKNLDTAVWNRLQAYLPPVMDRLAYAGLRIWSGAFLPVALGRIAPCEHARDIPKGVPVVMAVGSEDRRAPPSEARQILDQVPSGGKLVVFDGAAHVPLDCYNPELYRRLLVELLFQRPDETP